MLLVFSHSPLASSLIRPSVCTDPPSTNAVVVVKTNDGSSYTGLTSASIDDKRYLYAANFTLGRGRGFGECGGERSGTKVFAALFLTLILDVLFAVSADQLQPPTARPPA